MIWLDDEDDVADKDGPGIIQDDIEDDDELLPNLDETRRLKSDGLDKY